MECIGCDKPILLEAVAAYAIMNNEDFTALGKVPDVPGPGKFSAAAVCTECFAAPVNRSRKLKAHFSLPGTVDAMLGLAGSSTGVGG